MGWGEHRQVWAGWVRVGGPGGRGSVRFGPRRAEPSRAGPSQGEPSRAGRVPRHIRRPCLQGARRVRQCLPSVSSCPCLFFCPCSTLQIRGGSGRGVGHPSYGGGPRGTTPPQPSLPGGLREHLRFNLDSGAHKASQMRAQSEYSLALESKLAPFWLLFWSLFGLRLQK